VVQRRDRQRRFVRDAACEDPTYTMHLVRWFRAMAIQRAWRRFRVRAHRVSYLQARAAERWRGPAGWRQKRRDFDDYRAAWFHQCAHPAVAVTDDTITALPRTRRDVRRA
jgi:hypothetical protein